MCGFQSVRFVLRRPVQACTDPRDPVSSKGSGGASPGLWPHCHIYHTAWKLPARWQSACLSARSLQTVGKRRRPSGRGVRPARCCVPSVRTWVWEPRQGEQGWPHLSSLLGDFVFVVLTILASSSDPESQNATLSERDAGGVSLKVKLQLLVPRNQRARKDDP